MIGTISRRLRRRDLSMRWRGNRRDDWPIGRPLPPRERVIEEQLAAIDRELLEAGVELYESPAERKAYSVSDEEAEEWSEHELIELRSQAEPDWTSIGCLRAA